MKILFLISQRPDSTGSGFYTQALIKQACLAGHRCFLVYAVNGGMETFNENFPNIPKSVLHFDGKDLNFSVPGMSDVMPYKSSRFIEMTHNEIEQYKISFERIIKDAAETFQPDIIHSNHLWIMSAVARKAVPDVPMITSCHGTDLRQLKNCVHLKTEIVEGCRQIDRIIALSEIQKKEISLLYGIAEEKISVCGIGFNEKLFSSPEVKEFPPVKLLYAGKLSYSKGVIWLLKSLEKLSKLSNVFHLYIAGSGIGPECEEIKRLAGKIDNVTLCGGLEQKELSKLMKQSHIFVLPSFFEGLPLVLFEALASGCRIVTTSLPGTMEIVGNSPKDIVSFVELPCLETIDSPYESDMPMLIGKLSGILEEKINNIILNPKIDQTSVKKIIKRYTWEEIFKRIEKEYSNILRN